MGGATPIHGGEKFQIRESHINGIDLRQSHVNIGGPPTGHNRSQRLGMDDDMVMQSANDRSANHDLGLDANMSAISGMPNMNKPRPRFQFNVQGPLNDMFDDEDGTESEANMSRQNSRAEKMRQKEKAWLR